MISNVRTSSSGTIPSMLHWKWLGSGTYRFAPANDEDTAFDTHVYHCGFELDVDESKTVDNQGWELDEDYRTGPTVRH